MKKLNPSRLNHGAVKTIISTVACDHEIEFHPDDIIKLLESCCSDHLAYLINWLGKIYNEYEITEAYSVDDLNDEGEKFIENMYYFNKNK